MDLKIVQILYLVSIRFHVVENYHSSKSDFRGFMNSKNKHSAGVASLNASDGITYYDPTAKNIQNSKFSPLFRSNERKKQHKTYGSTTSLEIFIISISEAGVLKLYYKICKITEVGGLSSTAELVPVLSLLVIHKSRNRSKRLEKVIVVPV